MIKEKMDVSGTFISPALTPACGVEVTITYTGTVRDLIFPDRPRGPQHITISNSKWVATAGDNTVQFRDVGTEVTEISHDGTMTLRVTGHHPPVVGEVIGVVKTNLDTGETILETPQGDLQKLCDQLTG
jgi:hypothetical protein